MNSPRLLFLTAASVLSLLLTTAEGCSSKPNIPPPPEPPQQVQAAAPVVTGLTADRQVPPLGKTQITCDATDADSDNLTYSWTATGGTLGGSGTSVSWTAPDKAGDYLISVTVSDSTRRTAKKDIIINVPQKPNKAPVIEAVRFTRPKRMPITIKPNMTEEEKRKLPELVIIKYETADLSCLASDPDNDKLDYVWQATGGKLYGTGANIQWIAAGDAGKYTITVEVSDSNGGVDSFSIVINVHCCSG
jgi:hypothetical protein